MKWAFALIVLLAAAPAPAQEVVLGVLETGDFPAAIDTNTFFWGTLPDAQFVPQGWGGPAGTTDTFEFDLLQSIFPRHVWFDWHRGATIMPRETIIGLVQDSWYEVPRFDDSPTRIKFLRSPGVEEGRRLAAHGFPLTASPNPFRTQASIRLAPSILGPSTLDIYDACGSLVRVLRLPRSLIPDPHSLSWDGRDEADRELEAGVYICCVRSGNARAVLRLVKLD